MRKKLLIIAIIAFLSCSDSGNHSSEESRYVFKGNAPVMLNEVYSANADYKDEFGNKPGWAEFYNPADTAFNLKGYFLTNNANVNGALWAFGDAVISSKTYLAIFFSGRDKPDLLSPSDSVDLIDNAIGALAWADSENNPPGNSTAQYNFSKNAGISGTLTTTDNSPVMNYAQAWILLKLKGWNNSDVIDISESNQILLRGYLSKNSKLEICLVQGGFDGVTGWSTVIIGTGKENDLYTIELPPKSEFPDIKKIYGLRFANVVSNLGTINFSFNSIVAHKRESDIHVSFELNKSGGKLFLIDSLLQIRDSVSYPSATKDLSFAKNFESSIWALSKPPTPNSANSNEYYESQAQQPAETSIPNSGYYEASLSFTLPPQTEQGIIRCDTTGASPSDTSTLKSGSTLNLNKTTVLRCAQFKNLAFQSEPIMRTYIIGERLPNLPVVSIAVNPTDMFDSTIGIYATGPNANSLMPYRGANYWGDTELPVQIDFFESGAKHAWSNPAGIKIFGNWSRGHPKKSVAIAFRERYGHKNLRYPLFPEHPNLTKYNWFILRNNGSRFREDYIRDMLATSLTEGLGIDYQKGRAVIVYYNGEYFGIHNLRERSNADYFETNYGIDENNIDLLKGGNDVSRGSNADYLDIERWVESTDLNDENLEQLKRRIDLDNYTNYMQSEIYFLNNDWPGGNLKKWRSNSPISKWKWLLYDTDNGFYKKNLKMLDYVTEPNNTGGNNPPHATLFMRKLLQNQNYTNAFINRFSLLLATYYAPARVETRINALMNAIEREISLDQQRWNLDAGFMNGQLTVIRNFGRDRPAEMQGEIEEFFGLGNPVDFTISAKGNGKVLVHDLPVLNNSATFKAYSTIPITIKAVPSGGAKFSGWSDGVKEAERTVTVQQKMSLEAEF